MSDEAAASSCTSGTGVETATWVAEGEAVLTTTGLVTGTTGWGESSEHAKRSVPSAIDMTAQDTFKMRFTLAPIPEVLPAWRIEV